jgi:hypothetical protein
MRVDAAFVKSVIPHRRPPALPLQVHFDLARSQVVLSGSFPDARGLPQPSTLCAIPLRDYAGGATLAARAPARVSCPVEQLDAWVRPQP